jgi:hypothetical protein
MSAYRKPLNKLQLRLLGSMYKFRFVTSGLIASSSGANVRVINTRLKVLLDQEYIGRNYDSSYRIKGKQASYYLLPKGIKALSKQEFTVPKVINSLYRDKQASDDFINHQLGVYRIYVELKRLYPDTFNFFSRSELKKFDDQEIFPEKLPDAYLGRIKPSKSQSRPNNLFLDYYEVSKPFYQHRARIKKYIEYAEEEGWQDGLSSAPAILMVCETTPLMRRMVRLARKELETSYEDIRFLATTIDTLKSAKPDTRIWRDADEEVNDLVSLK